MLAAYRLPRLVRADGLGGEARTPRCVLAPGCPAAIEWFSLVLHCWTARVRSLAPHLHTRACVDGLSAFTPALGAVRDVAVAWTSTEEFGVALQLRLNGSKCVRRATRVADRFPIAEAPGPPVLASLRTWGWSSALPGTMARCARLRAWPLAMGGLPGALRRHSRSCRSS